MKFLGKELPKKFKSLRRESPLNGSDRDNENTGEVRTSYQSVDNEESEIAEDTILSNLEAATRRTTPLSDGFRPAIPGERAPLGVDSIGIALSDGDGDGDGDDDSSRGLKPVRQARPTFKQMAKTVQTLNLLKKAASNRHLQSSSSQDVATASHRRAQTLLASIDEAGKEEGDEASRDSDRRRGSIFTDFNTDIFAADPMGPSDEHGGLAYLWNEHEETKKQAEEEAAMRVMSGDGSSPEIQPLLSAGGGDADPNDSSTGAAVVMERRRLAQQRRNELRWKRLLSCLNPVKIIQRIGRILVHGTFVFSLPCFAVAWILFYYVGNPHLDFLPGHATISWWLNFIGRQLLVFEIARFTQFILIDLLTMSSRVVVQMLGAWVTIFCLQSKGWPFLATFWALYDMILLHGDNSFQVHWLFWTGIRIYSTANSGSYILNSSAYLRVLLGLMLAGVATSLKRTVLTLYFGRRSFDLYKSRLEDILNDIIVITEIAELGAEADNLPDNGSIDTTKLLEENIKKRGRMPNVKWSSLTFGEEKKGRRDSLDSIEAVSPLLGGASRKDADDPPIRTLMARTASASTSSGALKIKNLLDRWEEPINKQDKVTDSSVNDILKFRKALTYMDLEHPFGEAFGPASNRDELIKSAQILYLRLLKLSPESYTLPFSVLAVLAENEDGTVDRKMKKSITNLFRADADGEVPLLTFIQNCDVVYRRLRYFRASVGNSSVIDRVLENIINGFFAFGLSLLILSILNFNPWPLLVSVSTLLVSFAFAIGPTAAKAIEGVLLIVGTRPYDIGDRIIISNTPGQPTAGCGDSWFVEDISLFNTTLRLGSNNEVATVGNGTLAGTRITNCARSKGAVVNIILKLHISLHDGQTLEKYKEGLDHFVSSHPTIWDTLVFFRCEDINADDEYVIYRLAVKSRYTWQVAARIMADRGSLHQFCVDLSKRLKVNFDSPTTRRVFYYGGNLVDGAVRDFKKNLLMDSNNILSGDPDLFRSSGNQRQPRASSDRPAAKTPILDPEEVPPQEDAKADDLFLSMLKDSHQQ